MRPQGVSAFRKFISKTSQTVKASKKEQLRILCLKMKAEREQHEPDVSRGKLPWHLSQSSCQNGLHTIKGREEFRRHFFFDLAPVFEGMKALSRLCLSYQNLLEAHTAARANGCYSCVHWAARDQEHSPAPLPYRVNRRIDQTGSKDLRARPQLDDVTETVFDEHLDDRLVR